MRIGIRAVPQLAYVIAVAGMAALILYSSSPGAIVARSYASYNGRPLKNYESTVFQNVSLPYQNSFQPVSAAEARNLENGILVFAYPTCPFCRNSLPLLSDAAKKTNSIVYYCKLDDFRDKFAFNPVSGKPEKIVAEKEGYLELLNWLHEYLDDYTVMDTDGNWIPVGEKRITAPTVFIVKHNEPIAKWQLNEVKKVKEASEANGAYAPWSEDVKSKVTDSLIQFISVNEEG